jgi:hypothetical protein
MKFIFCWVYIEVLQHFMEKQILHTFTHDFTKMGEICIFRHFNWRITVEKGQKTAILILGQGLW